MFMDGAPRVYDLGLAVARMPATQPVGPDLTWLLGNYGKDAASTVQLLLVWAALLGCDVNHRSDGKARQEHFPGQRPAQDHGPHHKRGFDIAFIQLPKYALILRESVILSH